ncbi:Gfo/Idh/MocA family oxidoreductase [Caballeronia sp. GAWG1-1]|uniref:Gfo/Idh/MocA family protein n=1 Tax=Caballeronia sp. GAWG1-1 TaxID=2921742 RepID=UPI002028DDD7|nr:Gfo/Idh/MocA family oxidoreductase [Caballeronia sp. GAWG1-1]
MALKAALVGLGWWGRHLLGQMHASPALQFVAAIGSRDAHRPVAEEFGMPFSTDYEAMLACTDIDLVVIATPHRLHAQQVTSAAAHGKHVFCEKPLAMSREDARACIEACARAGVRLGTSHERRFEAGVIALAKLVRDGELGAIVHAEANFSHDKLASLAADNWRVVESDAVPLAMTGTAIHMTDLLADLLGEIEEVFATAPAREVSQAGRTLSLQVRFATGATGYINSILETPLYMRVAMYGAQGWAELRNADHPDSKGASHLCVRRADGTERWAAFEWNDSVRDNIECFCAAIGGQANYPVSTNQMLSNVAVMEAVAQSLQHGRAVRIVPSP